MDSQSSHQSITFLFTDIESHNSLWSRFPEKMSAVFRRHDQLIETIAEKHDGEVVRPRGEGDSRFIVFEHSQNALNAVVTAGEIQKALAAEPWPIPVPLRVRMAIHTGDATKIDKDYYGPDVNRCAGIRALAYGGQTLLSDKTAALVQVDLPPDLQLRDLQYHYLKGEVQPQQIFQLVVAGIPNEFLPLKKQPLPEAVWKQLSAEQRKRQALIENIQYGWIDGVLARSLQQSIMMNLRFELAPASISTLLPADQQIAVDEPSPAYLSQTAITDIYEQSEHQLLILGAPGSGKTAILTLLASMLLGEAERHATAPIPVILNLSSWAAKRNHLELWLVEELERQFRVPNAIGRAWVQNQQIIPLLDGLNEVAFAHRNDCVAAINEYQKTHRTNGLVVCCRSAEYAALQTQLAINAIEVQPLTFAEIANYFNQLDARSGDLVTRLQRDSALRELITSPLLVSILTVVHEDLPRAVADMPIDEYRTMLLTTYVEHALSPTAQRRPLSVDEHFHEPLTGLYSKWQMERWLHWLAKNLVRENQSIFYLDQMEQNWLQQTGYQILIFRITTASIFGILYGTAVGMAFFALFGAETAIVSAVILGISFGLAWISWQSNIDVSGTITLTPKPNQWYGIIVGLLFGGICSWVWGLIFGLLAGLFIGLTLILALGMDEIQTDRGRSNPSNTYGLIGSLSQRALIIGIAFGGATAMIISLGLGMTKGLALGFLFGGGVGLTLGGGPMLQNYILRMVLYFTGELPYDLIGFLEIAVENSLLSKVGYGYVFSPSWLLEYFASYRL